MLYFNNFGVKQKKNVKDGSKILNFVQYFIILIFFGSVKTISLKALMFEYFKHMINFAVSLDKLLTLFNPFVVF